MALVDRGPQGGQLGGEPVGHQVAAADTIPALQQDAGKAAHADAAQAH